MDSITQQMLAEIHQLVTQRKALDARYEAIREHLIQLFDNGAKVEKGAHRLTIKSQEVQTLSWPTLEKILTPEDIDFLRANVPATPRTVVTVTLSEKKQERQHLPSQKNTHGAKTHPHAIRKFKTKQ